MKNKGPIAFDEDDVPLYTVERIIDHKNENGKTLLLVKWVGWDLSDSTWEPRIELDKSIKHMVDSYFERLNKDLNSTKLKPRIRKERPKRMVITSSEKDREISQEAAFTHRKRRLVLTDFDEDEMGDMRPTGPPNFGALMSKPRPQSLEDLVAKTSIKQEEREESPPSTRISGTSSEEASAALRTEMKKQTVVPKEDLRTVERPTFSISQANSRVPIQRRVSSSDVAIEQRKEPSHEVPLKRQLSLESAFSNDVIAEKIHVKKEEVERHTGQGLPSNVNPILEKRKERPFDPQAWKAPTTKSVEDLIETRFSRLKKPFRGATAESFLERIDAIASLDTKADAEFFSEESHLAKLPKRHEEIVALTANSSNVSFTKARIRYKVDESENPFFHVASVGSLAKENPTMLNSFIQGRLRSHRSIALLLSYLSLKGNETL